MNPLLDIQVTQRTASLCGSKFCTINYDTLISSALAMLVTLVVAFWVVRRLRSGRPGKLQMLFEGLFDFVKTTLRDNVGPDAVESAKAAIPLATTVAFYIFVANIIAFFPLAKPVRPANSDLNQTLAMAAVVFIAVQWYSFRATGVKGFFRKFTKPYELPIWARVLFIPLNLIEEIAKPLTLAVRLLGNIFAGFLMVDLIASFFFLGSGVIHAPIGALGVVLMVGWKIFDAGIGVIQAFIFMLLTIIYFGMAREGIHGLEGHGESDSSHSEIREAA